MNLYLFRVTGGAYGCRIMAVIANTESSGREWCRKHFGLPLAQPHEPLYPVLLDQGVAESGAFVCLTLL